ncbi:MAG TPA: PQQ-binding-like beta-propeller repeat protein [Friedmanniella sp.]
MSGAGDGRWAPFPVQDWSTMPADPLAGPGVDPSWGPPAAVVASTPTGRPWWVPLVVLLCLGLLVGTGTWLARRAPEPRTPALTYVPADGDALWQRVDVTRESVSTTTTQVTESARFTGVDGLISADSFLTTRVLHQDYDADPAGARLWRTSTTSVDEVGIPSETTRYYRVRGSVELAGERAPDGTVTAYEPALVELPADVGPGTTWSGAGSAGATQDYASTFRAAPGRDGCLEVTGELELRARGVADPGRRTILQRTWCPGRGLVRTSESGGDLLTVATPVAAPAPGPRSTSPGTVGWTDPRDWKPRTWDTVTVDPTGETRAMYGSAATSLRPVLTASGLVVRGLHPPDDLVATTPKTTEAWTPVWSVHPGGVVLSLTAYGSVVLVTTSERKLLAYSDAGMRLWQATLPEIAPRAPVQVSDDDAVLVDLSGRVLRFGIADGAVRWTRNVAADVNRAPAVGAGLVVVADRGGSVTALDADTGAALWSRSFESTAVAVVGERVLVTEDQNLAGLDPGAGTTRFLTHFDGQLTELTGFDGHPLLASKAATLLLDEDGRVASRLPGYLAVDPTTTHLVGWTANRLDVLGADGRLVATWPTRSTSLVSSARPGLPTPQGVYLFGYTKGWTFDSWTTGG